MENVTDEQREEIREDDRVTHSASRDSADETRRRNQLGRVTTSRVRENTRIAVWKCMNKTLFQFYLREPWLHY